MQSAGAAVRRRSVDESAPSNPPLTGPLVDKAHSLVSVRSFAPSRASTVPLDELEEEKWGETDDQGPEGLQFPLITQGGPDKQSLSKAQLLWHTAYNKQRVARAFTNQLVINRGLYGRGSEEASARGQEVEVKYWTLSPRSKWKRWWDLAQALLLVYVALMVPYRVGFRDPAEGVAYWIDTAIDVYFAVDVVLNCITGYMDDEGVPTMVMEFTRIVRNYLRWWFWVDLLAIIPVDVLVRHYEGRLGCSFAIDGCQLSEEEEGPNSSGQLVRLFKLLRLFRLLKLLRLARVQRIFEKYQDDVFALLPILTLAKLLVLLLYQGHIIGCFYMFCSHPDFYTAREKEEIKAGKMVTWLAIEFGEDTAVESASRTDRYVASMYWAFTTMTTVGYGDISAVTTAERASAIAGMIIGGFVFSYIIGVIADVIANLDQSSRSHARKMQSVSQFVRDNELPKKERTAVLSYFRMQSVRAYSDEVLLMEMPYALRKSIVWFKFREIIDKVPFFYGERDYVKVEICSRFQTATYPPNTLVYQKSEASSALFVVARGEVQVTGGFGTASPTEPTGDLLAVLHQGSYFGEELVCGHQLRTATVRCVPPTMFNILDPSDLLYLVEIFPSVQRQLIDNFTKRQSKLNSRRPGASGSKNPGGRAAPHTIEEEPEEPAISEPPTPPTPASLRHPSGVAVWGDGVSPEGTPRSSPGLLAGAANSGGAGYRVGPPVGPRTGHAKAVRVYDSPAGSFVMPKGTRPSDDGSIKSVGHDPLVHGLLRDVMLKLDVLSAKVDRLEMTSRWQTPVVEQDMQVMDTDARGTTPRGGREVSRAGSGPAAGGRAGAGAGAGAGRGAAGGPQRHQVRCRCWRLRRASGSRGRCREATARRRGRGRSRAPPCSPSPGVRKRS